MRKILFVIADSSETGAPRQLRLLATHLPADFQVTVVCPPGPLAVALRRARILVHEIPPTIKLRAARAALRHILKTVQPDLVHAHGMRGGLWARLAARGRFRVIYTEHLWTSDFRLPDPIRHRTQLFSLKLLNRWTTHTIAVSEAVARFLIKQKITRADRLSTIYGAIDPMPMLPAVSPLHIGTLCSLIPIKGIEILLQAVALLKHEFPGLICHIGGSGPESKRLRALAKRLSLGDHVIWHGSVANPADFYAKIGIYVQSSFSESFGMAALEAMSCGRAVVVSDAGALPELVEHGTDGEIFPRGNAAALADALRHLINDPARYAHFCQAANARAALFTPVHMASQYAQLYSRILGSEG